nr:pyruvate kinase alpha/beta domain-containing protein [Pseudomonas oleovorans]
MANYTESGASSLRTSRERPKAPILSLTPSLTTARRLIVAWASTRWLTNTCARSRKSPAPPWKSPQAQGLAKAWRNRGDHRRRTLRPARQHQQPEDRNAALSRRFSTQ